MSNQDSARAQNGDNDLGAARAMAPRNNSSNRNSGRANRNRGAADPETEMMAQVAMAMHMSEMEQRLQERQMMAQLMRAGAGAHQA